jgi:hypothetical protein
MDPITWIVAGIAAIGGILNVGSGHVKEKKEKERLARERAEDLAIMDKEWEMAKKEAEKQAQKLDTQAKQLKEDSIEADVLTDIGENILTNTFNSAIDEISNAQKEYAVQLQNEMISTGANIANLESASGASGIRAGSGTNSEIIAQQEKLSQENREREQLYLDQSFQNTILNQALSLQEGRGNVRSNRLAANRMMENSNLATQTAKDIRDAYSEGTLSIKNGNLNFSGGDQWELFQMKRRDMFTDYQGAISNADFGFLDGLNNFLTGFNTSYQLANSIVTNFYSGGKKS